MVKAKVKDIKKELSEEQEEVYGNVDNPEKDDSVDEMYKETFGHEPIRGENIADEVEETEKFRRGRPRHRKSE